MSEIKDLIEEYRIEAAVATRRADEMQYLLAALVNHIGGEVKVQRKGLENLDASKLRIDATKKTFVTFSLENDDE